jgi:response regulator RpfG family c-di-GMP phosphodiesterase/serine/threonine protein kinase
MNPLREQAAPAHNLNENAADADRCAPVLLHTLIDTSIILPEAWNDVPKEMQRQLHEIATPDCLLGKLQQMGLTTLYQGERIRAGTYSSLVLGNYRVLGRLGSGAVSGVFEAEHILMRRKVALKVFAVNREETSLFVTRFLREMRVVAGLDHPNIVAAFDAGMCPACHLGDPDLYYFATELLTGQDLEQFVHHSIPTIGVACGLIYQIAGALDEAQRQQLVHRGIKPANIFVTENRQAKLLDFGLVRHLLRHDFTKPIAVVGALDYLAPEQVVDPTEVDIRTDIFSLGAVLYFALTGRNPFPVQGDLLESMIRRRDQEAPCARQHRPDLPPELDNVLKRMLAPRPEDRLATPQAVMHALAPFLENDVFGRASADKQALEPDFGVGVWHGSSAARVLIADHNPEQRRQFARALAAAGLESLDVADAGSVLARLRSEPIEAVLMSAQLPGSDCRAVVKALRDNPPCPNLKIILTSTVGTGEEMAELLLSGADDYLRLPLSNVQLTARVKSALKHKQAQDHQAELSQQLLDMNTELERSLGGRTTDLVQARNALVLALARLVEYRSLEAHAHLTRMQRYCTTLAQEAACNESFANQITPKFLQTLECCAPLHDIGNAGLPDHVLLKAGKLDEQETRLMQSHTAIGADTLRQVAHKFGNKVGFLAMAIDIARHHHENFDGTGYPDHLAGNDIPLAARIVAIADAYDSLRSRRAQRPSLTHASSLQIMLANSTGKFDPILLGAFARCACQFERIFRELPDSITIE